MKSWLPFVTKLIKTLWACGCLGVLVLALWIYDGTPATRDAEVLLIYGMLALSFPIGIAVGYALGGAIALRNFVTGTYLQTGYVLMLLEWGSCVAAGYWQWFVAVPWLCRWAKKWLRQRHARGGSPWLGRNVRVLYGG